MTPRSYHFVPMSDDSRAAEAELARLVEQAPRADRMNTLMAVAATLVLALDVLCAVARGFGHG
jgi:hypothetical protein